MTLRKLQSINPASGEVISEYTQSTSTAVETRLDMSKQAACAWRETSFAERAARFQRLAQILREDSNQLARIATLEMGKPLQQAQAEVEKCAWVCEYYAENAEAFLSPREEPTDAARSYVRYDPLGAILAIMPWNFPYWQVFRCAAPSVMAGNVVVLKHASNVSGVALEIEELFTRAEFPAGIFTTLLIDSDRTETLIADDRIQAITLTGSEPAGRAVAATAGRALKPTVMELGGSDPFIVLADADPQRTAAAAAKARCQNNGQSCIAAKRFLVEAPVAGAFLDALRENMEALHVGDPLQEQTELGPLARRDLYETLARQVDESIEQGAELHCGGHSEHNEATCYYPPTILTNVQPGMPAFDTETFGPVAAVTLVADRDEAIRLANHSQYGLGASVWTSTPAHAEELVARLESGAVFVNEMVKSNPHLPFGGVKHSGYGRELSREGIRAFTNVKSVWQANGGH